MKQLRILSLLLALVLLLTAAVACTPADQPEEQDPVDGGESGENSGDKTGDDQPKEDETMDNYVKLTEKGQKLYDTTYQTMIDRLRENGYAQTSLTGAYQGMFIRDASIQVMAHIAEGDLEMAKDILQYMAAYHKATDARFAHHIMDELKANRVWDYMEADMKIEPPALGNVPTSVACEDYSIALYKINMPTNGCGTQLTIPFDTISEVSFYLELSGKEGDIVVSIGTQRGDTSIAQKYYSIESLGAGKGWYTFKLDEPVTVEAGKKYVFHVWAENATGNIISYGTTSGGTGYNYDKPAFGGWVNNSQTLAIRVRSDCSLVGEANALTQTFVSKGDVIDTIEIETTCTQATKLYATLVDAKGGKLATAEAETAGGVVSFDFNSVKVKEDETYGLSIYAEKGDIVWNSALAASIAYKSADADQSPLGETYALRVYPEYSGSRTAASVTLGGDLVGKQTLPAHLNEQYVTSAQLYLSAIGTPAEGDTFTVSLYKGDALVSRVTRPLSMLSNKIEAYSFAFSLPLNDLDASEPYAITVSANKSDALMWCGDSQKDAAQPAEVTGKAVDALLSYRVGISDVKPLSEKIQVDGNYMWMNAYAMFAMEGGEEYADFVASLYDQMAAYSRYFIENGYIHENGLVFNPSYEHSRKGRYWESYDLITNCFASEALHKMSAVAESLGKSADAALFAEMADNIAAAVHSELISEFDGKQIYTELIALDEDGKVYKGFSFVSLAPIAADWYAVDEEIMANTYNAYLSVGTEKYSGIDMLGVVVELNEDDEVTAIGNHVIGKGLGWELYYLWKTGNTERLTEVLEFIDKRSNDVYPEVWRSDGSVADSANQEQASWILYEMARITGIYKK